MPQATAQTKIYTEDDYYSLPEGMRAELIAGQFYDLAVPSRIHQEISMFISNKIANYIDSKNGPCKVYTAPFAVKLSADDKTIVEPDISVICDPDKLTDRGCTGAPDWIVDPVKHSVYVYLLEKDKFETTAYTLDDKVKVHIYDDLWIDLKGLDL